MKIVYTNYEDISHSFFVRFYDRFGFSFWGSFWRRLRNRFELQGEVTK